ncbi:hypothetical protein BDD12DRAFT_405637 [Trichophaea hybrida]|nr:hypothetical protein BDD12DRAFT_405637 [Trichophaea hybrida]
MWRMLFYCSGAFVCSFYWWIDSWIPKREFDTVCYYGMDFLFLLHSFRIVHLSQPKVAYSCIIHDYSYQPNLFKCSRHPLLVKSSPPPTFS